MLVGNATNVLVRMPLGDLLGDLRREIPYVIGISTVVRHVWTQFRMAVWTFADAVQAVLWRQRIYLDFRILVEIVADVIRPPLYEPWISKTEMSFAVRNAFAAEGAFAVGKREILWMLVLVFLHAAVTVVDHDWRLSAEADALRPKRLLDVLRQERNPCPSPTYARGA